MVKLILAFILLANVFKVIESGRYFEDQDILFTMEENNKGYCFDGKEKQEQEQLFLESGSLITGHQGLSNNHGFEGHQFIPTHYEEPSSPPPNIIHS